MATAKNAILLKMLDRLFAGLVNGPNLSCRPHSSRQRLDVTQLNKLRDLPAEEALRRLLGADRRAILTARVPPPKRPKNRPSPEAADKTTAERNAKEADGLSPEEKAAQQAWGDQQALLGKLRVLIEDAKTYEQDTGVHVLNIGFPLLSLPPGSFGSSGGSRGATKRVLAPVAFIPVALTLKAGATAAVEIACKGEGVDLVSPNTALLAWLEQQTGKPAGDLFDDPQGEDSWREIAGLVLHAAAALGLTAPAIFTEPAADAVPTPDETTPPAPPHPLERLQLQPAPRADEADAKPMIVPAAVLGLFPANNQGLLQDTKAMIAGEALDGPVQSFIQAGVSLDQREEESYEHEAWAGKKQPRVFKEERLITVSDPCQSRAVRLARACRGLVVHGPPGTGKSQTITNVIGDHLARGERVLMVCDKRTALDVVMNRLEHLGLGSLCALVHDPRRDQRELYRSIREQLEALTDSKPPANPERRLSRADNELQRLHAELSASWSLLMEKEPEHQVSFHELMGQWLSIPEPEGIHLDAAAMKGASLEDFDRHEQELGDTFARAEQVDYAHNPWAKSAGIGLADFLSRPLDQLRTLLKNCTAAAREADATADEAIPPFARKPVASTGPPVIVQARARSDLAALLQRVLQEVDPAIRERWAKHDTAALNRARQKLDAAVPFLQTFRKGPLDVELELVSRAAGLAMPVVLQQLAVLEAYLALASRWYGVFFWKRRSQAAQVLQRYALARSRESGERVRGFLVAVRARLVLQALYVELLNQPAPANELLPDETLDRSLAHLALLVDLLDSVRTDPALAGMAEPVRQVLVAPAGAALLLEGLRRSAPRAAALVRQEKTLLESGLFRPDWVVEAIARGGDGQLLAPVLDDLEGQLDSLEGVLRIREGLAKLPPALRRGAEAVLGHATEASAGVGLVRKGVLAAEIAARLAGSLLQELDGQRLQGSLERYRNLDLDKKGLVRDAVLCRWVTRQKERLLVSTESRLSSQGADLRRRLTMRGERALRLRQVVAVGQGIDGGDPLFDLRPVWMASPETVAQVFPRRPVFDVVIFDEASQCRLEEALPVLTRARRVVIAGDPKQLPPTRFFESALAVSEEDEIETEEQLFEVHQGEIEDLLGAALGLDIQQCYLDVHYRSRNADLIEFSNQQFYSSRLQPLPGHPSRRARFAPITLYRAGGVYEQRRNAAEAEQVCRITGDLLKRAEPPSIGIACFNLVQRDLILEKLDELAGEDAEFGRRLADARQRRGACSFEGLFVKNLENVQGDERDHVIISTTYGPDPQGRFYRRFGPLGRAGGGRRLNVLVTRAREEVHLVTSIPPAVYRRFPPVPGGQVPGGAWLLFAYLSFAEQLAEAYAQAPETAGPAPAVPKPSVKVRSTHAPSPFVTALARQLAGLHHVGSEVYWGNDGFCVDLALAHPRHPDDVTLGVLCDGSRFAQAEDPVEWDVFRTTVLESQGWRLHRLWTPRFFRDPAGCRQAILREAAQLVAGEAEKDGLRVVKPADSGQGGGPPARA
jgi:hypothetical protein